MRLIHTADWHLCDRLGRIDRTADLKARVERVAQICEERQADVLLIAGDLFSEQATVDQMSDALKHIHQTFRPFFDRGGTILAVTGNHDRDGKINLIRAGMSLVAPPVKQGGNLSRGRFYLLNGSFLGKLASPDGGCVQFVLLPYPFPSRYNLSASEYRTKEEENRLLHGNVSDWLQRVSRRSDYDPSLATVLMAHLHVRGAELHSLYKLTEREDVLFDLGDLNPGWGYVALGHIHKPQRIGGASNVRYAGSLDRLDFGETHDGHGVLALELDRGKLVGEPECIPIPATPFYTLDLADYTLDLADIQENLHRLEERFPDRDRAIVRITVDEDEIRLGRDEITRTARRIFPRLHEIKWATAKADLGEHAPQQFSPRMSLETTVREYLEKKLKNDPDREAILALAETFLANGGEA